MKQWTHPRRADPDHCWWRSAGTDAVHAASACWEIAAVVLVLGTAAGKDQQLAMKAMKVGIDAAVDFDDGDDDDGDDCTAAVYVPEWA